MQIKSQFTHSRNQHAFTSVRFWIDVKQTDIAEVLTALEQHWEKTRALKQAMMQELLTGRTRLV